MHYSLWVSVAISSLFSVVFVIFLCAVLRFTNHSGHTVVTIWESEERMTEETCEMYLFCLIRSSKRAVWEIILWVDESSPEIWWYYLLTRYLNAMICCVSEMPMKYISTVHNHKPICTSITACFSCWEKHTKELHELSPLTWRGDNCCFILLLSMDKDGV